MAKHGKTLWIAAAMIILCGCDSVTLHKVTSTIFEGVPSLPPAEQYCKAYHQKALAEEREAAIKGDAAQALVTGSIHPPFAEKQCDNCHDKTTDSGFVVPKKEQLCAVCHTDFIKGAYAHGPAAVGACLECHVPHDSPNPKLLKAPREKICGICHREQRQARRMHEKVGAKGIVCVECHNPHAGNNPFFLD
jgi:predicted CXXCH cytochrome family protein